MTLQGEYFFQYFYKAAYKDEKIAGIFSTHFRVVAIPNPFEEGKAALPLSEEVCQKEHQEKKAGKGPQSCIWEKFSGVFREFSHKKYFFAPIYIDNYVKM